VAERRACRVLGQHRSTQRKPPSTPDDEAALTADIIALATQYGRYGYRRITALLRDVGGCATNCSTARSSTLSRRPRSSSKAGGDTTTLADRIQPWATGHPRPRCFCGRPHRPHRPWLQSRSCTNIQPGPPSGGRPLPSHLARRVGVVQAAVVAPSRSAILLSGYLGQNIPVPGRSMIGGRPQSSPSDSSAAGYTPWRGR
jgi:hypothetical protein